MNIKTIRVALTLVALSVVAAQATIISGPVTNPSNGHSFLLLANSSWTSAEAEAISLGGHLATVRNAAENQWMIDTFTLFGSQNRSFWIGLNDATNEGTFTWTSGEPVTFTNWASGEPNNLGNEDYVYVIQPTANPNYPLLVPGRWNDILDSGIEQSLPQPNGVVEIVPEPSSTALIFAALPALMWRKSRKVCFMTTGLITC